MKISRLMSIIMILMDKKRIGAQELANMFEVSTRTIYRDIETINMAGIPVYSTSGVGGGFEIMENYKIDKNTFSEADIVTLLTGIGSIPNVMKNDEFIHTLSKIKSIIPDENRDVIKHQTEQLHIDFSHWMRTRDINPYLNIIKQALQDNKLLSFHYINHHGEKTTRQVEPYKLILKNSQWYLHGYCYLRNDFRMFKLTRLSNLKIEHTVFRPRIYEKPLLETHENISKLQTTIKLRIHESIMEQLLDYCEHNKFSFDKDSYYFVDFPFFENDYYYGILLSFGEYCECLEPKHIRTELKRKVSNIAKLYK